jgi:hypothetical protein
VIVQELSPGAGVGGEPEHRPDRPLAGVEFKLSGDFLMNGAARKSAGQE